MPIESTPLRESLDHYARLLAHPNPSDPQNLKEIAEAAIALDQEVHKVIKVASPTLRAVAEDVEEMLKAPISEVSMLTAAQHYLDDCDPAELKILVQELSRNSFASAAVQQELSLLSSSISEKGPL